LIVIKLQSISVLVLAAAVAGCFAAPVLAEEPLSPENISESITRALFNQSGDIYRNRGIDRQATFLFGLSYPENEYTSDAAAVEKLYKQGMYQQGGSGKVVRTADLPNPFSSSIRTTPAQVKLTAVSDNKYGTPAPPAVSAIAPVETVAETVAETPAEAPAPRARW
jgi:hypothetical protein